jgi:hypothetical protein
MEFMNIYYNKSNDNNKIKNKRFWLGPYKVKSAFFGLTYERLYITQHTALALKSLIRFYSYKPITFFLLSDM